MKRAVRKRDVVELVEAFYRPPAPDSDGLEPWAASLCDFVAPLMDDGLGVVVRLDRHDPPETIARYVHTSNDALRRMVEHASETTGHDVLRTYLPNQGLHRLSDIVNTPGRASSGSAQQPGEKSTQRFVRDWVQVCATDGTGYLVVIAAPLVSDELLGGSKMLWQMVCAHLAAAFRLQRRRLNLLGGLSDSAIMDAKSGRVVHADGMAKEAANLAQIRAAVRAIDRARVEDTDAERALSIWKGLVDGSWSVVDRHDHDGRRYVVAVPNDPDVGEPHGLTEREAQVAALASLGQHDKLIAYTLGLERSTVATRLRRAMRKLGVRDRVELASVLTPTHERPARPSLDGTRAAIRRIDSEQPEGSAHALAIWRGLIGGSWSVVDRHDHEGRRYIVAVPGGADRTHGLSPREAQVAALAAIGQHDKLIAYKLGLTRSTVTTHLQSAIRKLGLRDRVELASVLTASPPDHPQRAGPSGAPSM